MRDDIGRWIALSERFADEGEMNLSKLLAGAVDAQVRRDGWRHHPVITRATMERELGTSIKELEEHGADSALIAALRLDAAKLARRDHRDLLADEAPDVFGCRTCGHIALRDHCPGCGSWPGRFRKFVAMFNADNAERRIRWLPWRSWQPTLPTSNGSSAI